MPTNFLQGLRHGALTGSVDRISWNVIRRQHIIAFDGGHQLGRFVNELALSTKLRPNLAVRVRYVQRRHCALKRRKQHKHDTDY